MIVKFHNTSTISLIGIPIFHGRSKHIKSRFHYIRERVKDKEIIVEHVNRKEQRTGILKKKKALAKIKFVEMCKMLELNTSQIPLTERNKEMAF